MWWYLLTLTLAHGLSLRAGRNHNVSNFNIIAELPGGLDATGIMFVNCVPNCASGTVLLNVTDLTTMNSIRTSEIASGLYDIQWTVPKDKRSHHIDMILVPSGCVERACRISEESYPECTAGSILTDGMCRACSAGAYQQRTECTVCAAGRYSSQGASECAYCPVGQFSSVGASSCVSPVATVQQTILFFGIPKSDLKKETKDLRNQLATHYGVPWQKIVIVSIGGDPVTGRRLSAFVPVEYRVLVYERADVQKAETRAVNLDLDRLVEKLVEQIHQANPTSDVTDVTATSGEPVTHLLSSVQEHSWDIAVPIGAGVVLIAIVLLFVCRTPTATPSYSVPLIRDKGTKIYF